MPSFENAQDVAQLPAAESLLANNRFVPLNPVSIRERRERNLDVLSDAARRWKRLRVHADGRIGNSKVAAAVVVSSPSSEGRAAVVALGAGLRLDIGTVNTISDRRGGKDEFLQAVVPVSFRSCNKFRDVVTCIASRADGSLVAAADESGKVFVCDSRKASIIRRWQAHEGPVRSLLFLTLTTLVSAGEDCKIHVWDIATEEKLASVAAAHSTAVSALAQISRRQDLSGSEVEQSLSFLSGGNDGYLSLWRFENKSLVKLNRMLHGHPIEALTSFKRGTLFVSAGGPEVKLWDWSGGSKLLATIKAHAKTVTNVATADDGSFIVTGSLDGTVKIHSTVTFEILKSVVCEGPVTAVALWHKKDQDWLLIGLLDGSWLVRRRVSLKEEDAAAAAANVSPFISLISQSRTVKIGSTFYNVRGIEAAPDKDAKIVRDHEIDNVAARAKPMMQRFHSLIQGFRFQESLDRAVQISSEVGLDFIEFLQEQGVLRIALRGRDGTQIVPLLKFFSKNFARDTQSSLTLLVFLEELINESPWLALCKDNAVIAALVGCRRVLSEEMACRQLLAEISGQISMLEGL